MSMDTYKLLISELDAGKKAVIVTTFENKAVIGPVNPRKEIFTEEALSSYEDCGLLEKEVFRKAQDALKTGNLHLVEECGGKIYLIEPYFPEPRLVILGGGHIAKPLAEFGSRVGFAVTVVDDRPSFANKARFPKAENVICESFQKCFTQLRLNMSCFVVIVTRGHRHDLDCLRNALEHDLAYVGMIGSRRRVESIREQLLGEGIAREKLDSVNAPIGLDIGAVTPEEIAISIIAQVISVRRLARTLQEHGTQKNTNWIDYDKKVMEELSRKNGEPRAIVTVISTKGSVPRKAGAKMLVWPDGNALGSIGGGCGEGEAIRAARDVLKYGGGFLIQNIDLTGYVAEEEGMVCGGLMKVLIESYNG